MRVMRKPHPIDAHGLDLFGIAAMEAVGDGVANERPGLVAVDTDELEVLAVEEKSILFVERKPAHAEAVGNPIHFLVVFPNERVDLIEIRIVR